MGSRQQGGCGSEKYQLHVLAGGGDGDGSGGTDKNLGSKTSMCRGLDIRGKGVGISRVSKFGDWQLIYKLSFFAWVHY